MITRKRSKFLAAVFVLIALILLAFRSQSAFQGDAFVYFTFQEDELCTEDSGSCDASYDETLEEATAIVSKIALDSPRGTIQTRTGPAKIVYPSGYERFGLKSPADEATIVKHAEATTTPVLVASTLAQQLEEWVPYIAQEPINKVIWQTWHDDPGPLSIPFASWRDRHQEKDSFKRYFVSDAETEQLMTRLSRDLPVLKTTYDSLPRIMQLDYLRTAALFKDGGVYADFDTMCYQPVESWLKLCGDEKHTPGFAVGIDMDLEGDLNFDQVDGRQLLLSDYIWVARKGHPILRDLLRDMTIDSPQWPHEATPGNVSDVRAWTGRVRFTDTVIRHVQKSVKGFSAQKLHGLKEAKMFGDVCVFEIAAFGSGQRKFGNSPETEPGNKRILAKHYFMRSWEK
ncbi:hypothetical protein BCR37DRAFT_76437 [Protomyces lactucae-debilis]|uniref:Nucleotide-diphospho-sugar transferase n=1 Tax=Protomyces lactucae-debilis TaxID=2754530 RepID=A0A1Y2F8A2_PROLT|nr:uncharacterized protein BCR37DRAFT_76437 [Protomyces lactucae-debilis]ORY79867.1 hypothetical protein BCR37DRAFT_76437 [Protomyces lactucae-debilis]